MDRPFDMAAMMLRVAPLEEDLRKLTREVLDNESEFHSGLNIGATLRHIGEAHEAISMIVRDLRYFG